MPCLHRQTTSTAPTSLPPPGLAESMAETTIESAEATIMKWNPDFSVSVKLTSMFHENEREAFQFIKLVNDLHSAMHILISRNPSCKLLIQAQTLMAIAMKRLQKEFRKILCVTRTESVRSFAPSCATARSSSSVDGGNRIAADFNANGKEVSSIEMAHLKAIAECMITSGYSKECLHIYKTTRKAMMEKEIFHLGIEKLTFSQINKMDSDVLEIRIRNWLKAFDIAMKKLFAAEKIICDHVFAITDLCRKSCFTEVTKESSTLLFSFPELVAKKKMSPDKIFLLLNMYKALSRNMPKIEKLFSFDLAKTIRLQTRTSFNRINESVRTMLSEFESSIEKDPKVPVAGVGLHKLTVQVMSYLSVLAEFSGELTSIFADIPSHQEKSSFLKSYFFDRSNSDESPPQAASTHIAWLIILLFCKLQSKAKHYNDISQSNLFLANNFHYVVSTIRSSKLNDLLDGDWITKHETKSKQFVEKYEQFAWDPVLATLPANPMAPISAMRATEIFRNFGQVFEQTCRKESENVVQDPKLSEEIKLSIARKLEPIYEEFYHAHRERVLGGRRRVGLNVRFAPEDVGNYLWDLFSGQTEAASSPTTHFRFPDLIELRRLAAW